jgi:hypothetical protein
MIKAITMTLSLMVAAPLVMSTAASAQSSAQHHAMHKGNKTAGKGDARHGAMHAKDRATLDRQEAKVTSELNQRELGSRAKSGQ